MRAHRSQWVSYKINFRHQGQLKKLKSWEPFWSYQLNSTANQANLPQNWTKLAILDVLFSWYRESSNSTVFWTQKKPYQWKSILLEEFLWYKLVSRGFKKSKVHFLTAKSRAVLVWAFFSFSAISSNSHLGWEIRKVLCWIRIRKVLSWIRKPESLILDKKTKKSHLG